MNEADAGIVGSHGPLTGVRVLELGSLIAGPLATRILADFGAEVIKVEPDKGDPLRTWGKVTHHGSLWSMVQSRNKKTISLNLDAEPDREIVRRLAAQCDVVVENFRPGRLEAWGLGHADLKRENPDLIMVRISGYGQTGPYREKPGFGNIAESMGGIRYITGYPDQPPVRVGLSLGDSVAALYSVIGALLALYWRDGAAHRRRRADGSAVPGGSGPEGSGPEGSGPEGGTPGRGQMVDVALTEAVFSLLEGILPEYGADGTVRERQGNLLSGAAPSNMYPTREGTWFAIGANGDGIFRRFAAAIGRPELTRDPRFADGRSRVANARTLDALIADWTRLHTPAELSRMLDAAGVPAGPVYSIADIARDPQFLARNMILHVPDERVGEVVMPGVVPTLSETPGAVRWAGQGVGAHNQEVLGGLLGLSDEEIEALKTERGQSDAVAR
jgi:crotonobetainyl-CoA:carnitine CoA-transferase CaiB-like acyl-CoA transferase